MNIEEYKIKYGYKELPWHFYLRSALFWCWLMILPLGFLCYFKIIGLIEAMAIYIPWALFWCMKAVKKMQEDKLKLQGKK